MPTFRYSAYRPGGNETAGTIEAENLREARLRLKREGLFPREIAPAEEAAGRGILRAVRKRVALPELALMTRRLSTLIGSA
ncbi:MAG TPA: type II secretion system protein GspF, partial [Candidatus Limnocylindria bacterium]|nr:type II secretion system protein GspF [Candidatus Limnocylindria bacterium]